MKKLIFTLLCLSLAGSSYAATIIVKADGSGDYPTIQAAIDDANEGDIVEVWPGTYTGDGNRDIDPNGKNLTICSIDPNDPNIVAATIIDCNSGWLDGHRGFHFHSSEDTNSILDGLTVKGGLAWGDDGGGILIENSNPTIRNCVISNNSTYFDMATGDHGGGICCKNDGNAVIINCTITENSAGQGGGVYCLDSAPTFIQCTISYNLAKYGGSGGGMCNNSSNPVLNNCTITENSAGLGGGMFNWNSNPVLTNSAIIANIARFRGGGILCEENSSPRISNCVIVGNKSVDPIDLTYGGGIHCLDNSNPLITNCTIAYNHTSYEGGGIWCYFSAPIITNSILWGNTAVSSGSQIALSNPSWPSTLTVSYCDIQGGQTDAYVENGCSLDWLTGNIDKDPCFVDPGYWDPNGTPSDANDDFWVNGDYHLKSEGWRWDTDTNGWTWDSVTSRCIDAGNPGCDPNDEPLPNSSNRINMGAYGGTVQASIPPHDWALLADLNNDGTVSFEDYAKQAIGWHNNDDCQPGDLDRDGVINMTDLALFVEDWLKETTWH